MKIRLGLFVATLLILPLAGLHLGGATWNELATSTSADANSVAATLRTTLLLAFYVLLLNHSLKRLTGHAPLDAQRHYFIGLTAASAVLGWLLSYLNLFVGSWTVAQNAPWFVQFLLYTPLFALLAPAVLLTRALLGSFPGLLKALAFSHRLPAPNSESAARVLLLAALTGLAGGAAWPEQLAALLWVSPLLLLMALQLLWHESTIFSRTLSGDWGRILCTLLAGVVVGNLALIGYQANALLLLNFQSPLYTQAGFALFGLLCLQLGDVMAEGWRGKSRTAHFQHKKKFPIPVVVVAAKKD